MEINDLTFIHILLYAIGGILKPAWPDRLAFSAAIGSVIAWLARL